ncbi:hypothetical protein CAOG_000658 [Capsaspora owczarzaki ATCC 30864]|uniref:J domain-containing protein n=2 Tax=Capsaspora owczarzaki (strain ATCC 30864) TaxID=595528 RepID=A0A0D2VGW6_CAPO3|nr:hypothetical protein CAOG_000658 [Capsaspora owczarzaki ATCC 30864]
MVLIGTALAAVGVAARAVIRASRPIAQQAAASAALPGNAPSRANTTAGANGGSAGDKAAANDAAKSAAGATAGPNGGAPTSQGFFGNLFNNLTQKRYDKGGFEPVMTRREAASILNVGVNAPKEKIKEAHKRVMAINHPDRGGSPYIAAKINEAKDLLESKKQMSSDR